VGAADLTAEKRLPRGLVDLDRVLWSKYKSVLYDHGSA